MTTPERKNLCPKMADQASKEVPVPVPGRALPVLLHAPPPTHTRSAKYAEVEVYKLPPPLACAQGSGLWRSFSSEPPSVK